MVLQQISLRLMRIGYSAKRIQFYTPEVSWLVIVLSRVAIQITKHLQPYSKVLFQERNSGQFKE
jgi:hypothetical protein